jgi:hypothetical protein
MVANADAALPFTIQKLFGDNFGVLQTVWEQLTTLRDENKELRALTTQACRTLVHSHGLSADRAAQLT